MEQNRLIYLCETWWHLNNHSLYISNDCEFVMQPLIIETKKMVAIFTGPSQVMYIIVCSATPSSVHVYSRNATIPVIGAHNHYHYTNTMWNTPTIVCRLEYIYSSSSVYHSYLLLSCTWRDATCARCVTRHDMWHDILWRGVTRPHCGVLKL